MKKSDLRTGMVVEDRGGAVGVVLLNTATVDGIKWFLDCDKDKIDFWQELNEYNDDLMLYDNEEDENDIMKIYQPCDFSDYTTMRVYCEDNLIIERETIKNISGESKEITMKDIEEKFGCKVKIVG